jgi:16S rRNA (cytosine1402-N4)-methyltransferase
MMVRMSDKTYHTPVLLQACIEYLNIDPDGIYVDLTFGGGGHSSHILKQLGKKGRLFAFDQDRDAQKNALKDERFTLIPQNFRFIKNYLRLYGVTKVNGILGDLGVSSHQFDEAERGFSIRFESELDMRMNPASELSAKKVLNESSAKELTRIFGEYGELKNAGRIAKLIIEAREAEPINNTVQFKKVLQPVTPKFESHKFLAKVFQAIRIEVNQEITVLKECLTQCVDLLDKEGRLVIISYHSLEDRIVKNLIRSGNVEGIEERDPVFGSTKKIFKNLTSSPIVPGEEEIKRNTRARSAKMRAAERL